MGDAPGGGSRAGREGVGSGGAAGAGRRKEYDKRSRVLHEQLDGAVGASVSCASNVIVETMLANGRVSRIFADFCLYARDDGGDMGGQLCESGASDLPKLNLMFIWLLWMFSLCIEEVLHRSPLRPLYCSRFEVFPSSVRGRGYKTRWQLCRLGGHAIGGGEAVMGDHVVLEGGGPSLQKYGVYHH